MYKRQVPFYFFASRCCVYETYATVMLVVPAVACEGRVRVTVLGALVAAFVCRGRYSCSLGGLCRIVSSGRSFFCCCGLAVSGRVRFIPSLPDDLLLYFSSYTPHPLSATMHRLVGVAGEEVYRSEIRSNLRSARTGLVPCATRRSDHGSMFFLPIFVYPGNAAATAAATTAAAAVGVPAASCRPLCHR